MSVAVGGKNGDTGCPQTCAKLWNNPPKLAEQNKLEMKAICFLNVYLMTQKTHLNRCRHHHVLTASAVQTFVLSAFMLSSPNFKCEKNESRHPSVWVIKVSPRNDFRGASFSFDLLQPDTRAEPLHKLC